MKIKRTFLLGILMIKACFCYSQEINVYWSKEYPVSFRESTYLLGKRNDHLIGYKVYPSGNLSLLKYSSELQLSGEVMLIRNGKITENGPQLKFDRFILLRTKNYIGVTSYDSKSDIHSYYIQEFSVEEKLLGELKKIAEISAKRKANSGSFNIALSDDSSKFLLVNNPPYDKYAGEKFDFKIFDEYSNNVSSTVTQLPYKDKNVITDNVILSNAGNIFMLARISKEKENQSNNESDYYYEIIAVNPTSQSAATEYEVNLPGKNIIDLSFEIIDDEIVCAGFYNDIGLRRNADDINGIFYLRIDNKTKSVKAKSIKELERNFVADLTSKRKADKGRGIAGSFKIKNFIKKENGETVLIAENAYDYERFYTTTTANGIPITQSEYHHIRNNIIAINIDSTASIKWYCNIPKYQHTINDNGLYSSYMFMEKNNLLYFIYNDNPRNLLSLSNKDAYSMGRPQKSVAVIVGISETGSFTKKKLFSNKDNNMILLPSQYKLVSKSEQVAPALKPGFYLFFIPIRHSKQRLVRFEYK